MTMGAVPGLGNANKKPWHRARVFVGEEGKSYIAATKFGTMMAA
jgi:hypothetical protein